MSGIGDADLVRVCSHEELRVGMTLVDKSEDDPWTAIVLKVYVAGPLHEDGSPCTTDLGFFDSDTPDDAGCYCDCIAEGTLYRLRDLGDADEICRRTICDLDDLKRASQRKRVGFPLAGRAR